MTASQDKTCKPVATWMNICRQDFACLGTFVESLFYELAYKLRFSWHRLPRSSRPLWYHANSQRHQVVPPENYRQAEGRTKGRRRS